MSKDIILDLNFKSNEIKDFEKALNKKIIGQEDAKETIVSALERSMYPISDKKRTPLGIFLFIGPPGVGKTEVARTIAEYLLGDDKAFTKIDCGQYKERHQRSRLLGSPPSYVGYSTVPILSDVSLFKHAKTAMKNGTMNPIIHKHGEEFAIVLLDEFEKMHPELQDVFLAAFDEGAMTLDNGIDEGNAAETKKNGVKFKKEVSFKKTIFIMTSNAGSREIVTMNSGKKTSLSLIQNHDEKLNSKVFYEDKLKDFLRPEFLSRVEEIVPFRELTREEYMKRLEYMITDYSLNIETLYGITIDMSKKAKNKLLDEAISPEKGARVLNQKFEKYILGHISKIVGSGQLNELEQKNFHIFIDVKGGEYIFKLKDINKRKVKISDSDLDTDDTSRLKVMTNMNSGNYSSYINFQVEEIIPRLSSLNILYEFRDEVDSNFAKSILDLEADLKNIGFTDLDFSIIRKTGFKAKLDDLASYIYNYDGVDLNSEFSHLEEHLDYIKKFVKNKFEKNINKLDKNQKSYDTLLVEIESFLLKILDKSFLNKQEMDLIVILVHKEYLETFFEGEDIVKKENNNKIAHPFLENRNIPKIEHKPETKEIDFSIFANGKISKKEDILEYIKEEIKKQVDVADIAVNFEVDFGTHLTKNQITSIFQIYLQITMEK